MVNCLLVVLQGPRGELAWTFVPEVILKEVGSQTQQKVVVSHTYVRVTGPS